jgi:transcriptional regulator with XRE-family HTH domain
MPKPSQHSLDTAPTLGAVWVETVLALTGLTATELARKTQVSIRAIALWRAGKSSPTIATMHKVCKKLGLEMDVNLTVAPAKE